ncbi:MAG: GPMC system MBL fold metallohydrolase [Desulfuromonadaceae bacterium]|nr:GPMC system MBL fold metallohydrolase [Desulfuromonadaceae bacterium]
MIADLLHVTILGSGTSSGVPMIGCSCPVCTSTDQRNRRTRCSVLVGLRERNILIDTATDLRQQALREQITQIDAVLYTHAHADHTHGIDDLRAFNPAGGGTLPIYAAASTLAVIRRTFAYIFSDDAAMGYRPRLAPRLIDAPVTICGFPVEPLPLRHGHESSLGYRIGNFAYLADCSAIPAETLTRLANLDVLILDGLRFRPHASHFNITQAIDMAQIIGARRTLLTHLTHDIDHAKHTAELPAGIEFAYDGLRLELPLTAAI